MKKPASKVAEPAQIQPKSQFLFHKNLPPRDFSIITLTVNAPKAIETGTILFVVDIENKFHLFWKKGPDQTVATILLHQA